MTAGTTHTELLCKGRVMTGAARTAAEQQLLRFLERRPQIGWVADAFPDLQLQHSPPWRTKAVMRSSGPRAVAAAAPGAPRTTLHACLSSMHMTQCMQ